MRNYKITFLLKSSVRSKFQSDTIFGHICWAYRYLYGNDKLEQWLQSYEETPTLISNAFPDGYMPKPILRPLSYQTRQRLNKHGMSKDKKHKKILYIKEKWFWENQNGLTSEKLYLYLNEVIEEKETYKVESTLVTHNRFNRKTGRADEGGLYDTEEDFYLSNLMNDLEFWFLIKSDTLTSKMIEEIMSYISLTGFGADKSMGKGHIEITNIQEFEIPNPDKINGFVSISNFIPAKAEDINGYYRTLTKFGKLAEDYATGGNPFKKPIIMLEAGAVIKTNNFSWTNYYGKLQTNIHSSPNLNIVQYGYAFPIPIYYEEENNEF